MFMQWRILYSRSATVSQYPSSCGVGRDRGSRASQSVGRLGRAPGRRDVDRDRAGSTFSAATERVGEVVELALEFGVGLDAPARRCGGTISGRGPEQLGGEDVHLRGEVDRLAACPA